MLTLCNKLQGCRQYQLGSLMCLFVHVYVYLYMYNMCKTNKSKEEQRKARGKRETQAQAKAARMEVVFHVYYFSLLFPLA